MELFSVFIKHQDDNNEWHNSGGLLLRSNTGADASIEASAMATSLIASGAQYVRIFLMGSDPDGHPLKTIEMCHC
jgi:hypothetical protein